MESGRHTEAYQLRRVSDFQKEGMLWVGTVRSPEPSGRIVSISIPRLNRDYRSITAEDIPGSRVLDFSGSAVPVLASGRVAYKGEPIALIAGPSRARVAEAVRLSKVIIEADRPELDFECFDSQREMARSRLELGDAEGALSSASRVLSAEYGSWAQDHYYPEPQGAAAAFDYDKLVVYASTQWPFHVRDAVKATLGVKAEEVVVRPTLLGPHLDGKLWYPSLLASHAALAARLCKKPALLLLSREEDFLYTTKRAPMLCSLKAALDDEGRLSALDARIAVNAGAYGPFAQPLIERSAETLAGLYACPNVRVRAWAAASDLPPMGAFAGLGSMNMAFARERMADDLAALAGMDPAEWRELNSRSGARKKSSAWSELEPVLLSMSDYRRKRSAYELMRRRREDAGRPSGFGIGLAFAAQPLAAPIPGASARVEVELSKNLTLTIRTSALPGTSGTALVWKAEAASIIGIEERDVFIEPVSTDRVPDSGPALSSRGVAILSHLIIEACQAIRQRRFREALPIQVSKAHRPRASRSEIQEASSWAGAVVELRLDPLDQRPVVRGLWLAVKAGRVLSPARASASLARDAAQAIGLCLAERLSLDKSPDLDAFLGYQLHRLKDKPPIHVRLLDGPQDALPAGIGELAYLTVPAAWANAMTQASDGPWNVFPGGSVPLSQGKAE